MTSIIGCAQLVHRDEPLVDQPEDELGPAAPADRVAVRVVLAAVEHALLLAGSRMIGSATSWTYWPGEPAEAVDVDAELVDRRDHRQVVAPCESAKSSLPQPGAMWTMPVPSSALTSSQAITRCATPCCGRQLVERPAVGAADQLAALAARPAIS